MEEAKKSFPLGMPEGSVRALIGLFVIGSAVIGLLFSKVLNLEVASISNLTTLAGTALGYYFGTRNSNKKE